MSTATSSGRVTLTPAEPLRPGGPGWTRLARRVLPPLFSLAIVALVFWYFLPQFTSISAVWASARSMTWLELTTLGLLAVWNLATYWIVMVTTMPGLTYRQAAVATESSTAVSNTVPGGGALGIAMNYAMFHSWGFSRSRASVALLVSGVWNNFAKLGMPVIALALLALQGNPSGGRLIAGVLGVAGLVGALVLFGMLLKSDGAATRLGLGAGRVASWLLRLGRRPPVHGWDKATTKFRARTVTLLKARWHWVTLSTLVSHVSLYLVLLLALRHVGISNAQLGWAEVLAIFAFARLLTAIPFTPGGLGVVEFALITGLSAAGGPRAAVAAAVLIFRALTYVLPIPLGLATYVFWRRNRSWRRLPGAAPRTDLVAEQPSSSPVPVGA
jgi:putative heme transporter